MHPLPGQRESQHPFRLSTGAKQTGSFGLMDAFSFQEPPVAGGEAEQLLGILDRTRSVLAWKCGGVDAAGMRATVGPSTVSLGGLLKHLAFVEDITFTWKLSGGNPLTHWDGFDWQVDPDWVWRTAADQSPEELFALWHRAVERARASVAHALSGGDLGQLVNITGPHGEQANLRRLLLDMIDEYARHNGHADLIRESVDGLVGEDPPGPEAA